MLPNIFLEEIFQDDRFSSHSMLSVSYPQFVPDNSAFKMLWMQLISI